MIKCWSFFCAHQMDRLQHDLKRSAATQRLCNYCVMPLGLPMGFFYFIFLFKSCLWCCMKDGQCNILKVSCWFKRKEVLKLASVRHHGAYPIVGLTGRVSRSVSLWGWPVSGGREAFPKICLNFSELHSSTVAYNSCYEWKQSSTYLVFHKGGTLWPLKTL